MKKLILILGLLVSSNVWADKYDYHYYDYDNTNTDAQEYCDEFAAMAAISGLQFGVRTRRPQASLGVGGVKGKCDRNGLAGGVGARIGEGGPLVSGGIARAGGANVWNMSINLGF